MPNSAQPLEGDEAQLCRRGHERSTTGEELVGTGRRSVLGCQGQTSLKQWTRQPATRKEAACTTVATRSSNVSGGVSPGPTNLMCVSQTCFTGIHMLHRGLVPAWRTKQSGAPDAFEPVGGTRRTHLRQYSNRGS